LVFVGGGNLTTNEKKRLYQAIGDNYKHYQGVSNYELNLLYNNAYCLVYPSAYEGFGIPVIEAQSAGCPVIASNKSSLPEILGDSAILLEEVTSQHIYKSLNELENLDVRNSLISKGVKNSEKYSWNIMSQKYLDVYMQIWKDK
jgi:mannosyltransferase